MENYKNREVLNNKVWYRAVKVLFGIIAIGGFFLICISLWVNKPQGALYYNVQCTNGKQVNADLIPTFKLTNERVDHGNVRCSSKQLTQEERQISGIGGGRLSNGIDGSSRGIDRLDIGYTYTIEHKLATFQEYKKWIGGYIWWFAGWFILLIIIQRIFFYIVLGEYFFSFDLFKKKC